MSRKTNIWEYFEDNENIAQEIPIQNTIKRNKTSENKTKYNESIWLKSLLHPSMEQKFVKVDIIALMSCSETKLICKIKSENQQFLEFNTLLGYFDIWWWKTVSSKTEFAVLEEISNRFPFIRRILKQEKLMIPKSQFYLLLDSPVVASDVNDAKVGIVTCRRFIIIE